MLHVPSFQFNRYFQAIVRGVKILEKYSSFDISMSVTPPLVTFIERI